MIRSYCHRTRRPAVAPGLGHVVLGMFLGTFVFGWKNIS
jgi:hypothetical protein